MPNAADYYKAAIPEPWTILGLRLRPFAAGHLILLHRFDIGFATEEPVGPGDIIAAAWFCSRTYEESLAGLQSESLDGLLAEWGRQLLCPTRLQRWGLRRPDAIDWQEKALMFGEYIKHGSTFPHFSYREEQFKRLDLPVVQTVICALMKQTSLTHSEILNRPYGLSLWDYITLRAMDGSLDVTDREPIERAMEMAKRVAEAIEARRAKANGETGNNGANRS